MIELETSKTDSPPAPDALDEVVWRVCRLLFRHIMSAHRNADHAEAALHWKEVFGERVEPENEYNAAKAYFHEKLYVKKKFRLIFPLWLSGPPPSTLYRAKSLKYRSSFPRFSTVFHYMRRLCRRAQLSQECPIICLIYIERLMSLTDARLTVYTWRPLIVAGLLLASKVWEDVSCWNVEFAELVQEYALGAINRLERTFCAFLDFKLHIDGEVYASYYFDLRELGPPPWLPQLPLPSRTTRILRKTRGRRRPETDRIFMSDRLAQDKYRALPEMEHSPLEENPAGAPSSSHSPPPLTSDIRRKLAEAEDDGGMRMRFVRQQLVFATPAIDDDSLGRV